MEDRRARGAHRLSLRMDREPGARVDEVRAPRTDRRPARAARSRRAHPGDRRIRCRDRRRRPLQPRPGPRTALGAPRNPVQPDLPLMKDTSPLRVGIGGPVGSAKTALTLALCKALRDKYDIAAVTNDIYTEEDAQFLVKNEALAPERIIGVETGGWPHTAIPDDPSINLHAVARLNKRFPALEGIFIESRDRNLAAPFTH